MIHPRIRTALFAAVFGLSGCATMNAPESGMVSVRSPYPAAETVKRLDGEIRKRGLSVVARIDHAAGAAKIGRSLRPTELLVFGSPQAGTPLMECIQPVGIDLPMKALVWVDAQSQVWIGYNDPAWILRRHGGADCPAAENVRKALAAIVSATVAP